MRSRKLEPLRIFELIDVGSKSPLDSGLSQRNYCRVVETFKEITPTLVGKAQQHAVDYDGWETFVNKPAGWLAVGPSAKRIISPQQTVLEP